MRKYTKSRKKPFEKNTRQVIKMFIIDTDVIKEMAVKDKRIDKRKFEEYRKAEIEPDVVTSAEGSARVKLGNTEVVAGIKMDLAEPYPDTPEEGTMSVAVEFVPLASPEFESGPPREDSIEVSRVVDRAIRESKMVDFKKLCVTPGEKVWMVFIDIDIINNDGNLIDACGLAAASALVNAKIPEIDKDGNPDYTKKKDKLPVSGVALSTTFAKIGRKIMADPNLSETEAMHGRLTVGTIEKDKKIQLCSMQKGGTASFSLEEIEQIIEMAEKKGTELRKLVK